jgi:hypothetical protein
MAIPEEKSLYKNIKFEWNMIAVWGEAILTNENQKLLYSEVFIC